MSRDSAVPGATERQSNCSLCVKTNLCSLSTLWRVCPQPTVVRAFAQCFISTLLRSHRVKNNMPPPRGECSANSTRCLSCTLLLVIPNLAGNFPRVGSSLFDH